MMRAYDTIATNAIINVNKYEYINTGLGKVVHDQSQHQCLSHASACLPLLVKPDNFIPSHVFLVNYDLPVCEDQVELVGIHEALKDCY